MTDYIPDKYQKYRNLTLTVPAVKQQPQKCWAAAIEWWSRATGRPVMTAEQIFQTYSFFANKDGTINVLNLATVLLNPIYRANVRVLDSMIDVEGSCMPVSLGNKLLMEALASGPAIVGYTHISINARGAHVVVALAPSITFKGHFMIMEPATGQFTHRAGSLFRAGECGRVLLAWPR